MPSPLHLDTRLLQSPPGPRICDGQRPGCVCESCARGQQHQIPWWGGPPSKRGF